MKLALKIVSEIRARETFAVYVVIPLWPEGVPSFLLYKRFYTASLLDSILLDVHPQDYFNFNCLGKQEELPAVIIQEAANVMVQ
ncbi:phospholipase D delta [Tanacetum coccineum]